MKYHYCPACFKRFEIPEHYMDRIVSCPECSAEFTPTTSTTLPPKEIVVPEVELIGNGVVIEAETSRKPEDLLEAATILTANSPRFKIKEWWTELTAVWKKGILGGAILLTVGFGILVVRGIQSDAGFTKKYQYKEFVPIPKNLTISQIERIGPPGYERVEKKATRSNGKYLEEFELMLVFTKSKISGAFPNSDIFVLKRHKSIIPEYLDHIQELYRKKNERYDEGEGSFARIVIPVKHVSALIQALEEFLQFNKASKGKNIGRAPHLIKKIVDNEIYQLGEYSQPHSGIVFQFKPDWLHDGEHYLAVTSQRFFSDSFHREREFISASDCEVFLRLLKDNSEIIEFGRRTKSQIFESERQQEETRRNVFS